MLEVAQTGQIGKTNLLLNMHRFRKRVFHDRMGWDVDISKDGLEIDAFDLPNAVYLLAIDQRQDVIGTWRLLPTSGPTMIRDVWPHFTDSLDMPADSFIWEASRFAVDSASYEDKEGGLAAISRATEELFCGLVELALICGIREIYTLYDMRIARLLKRLNCPPRATSERSRIDGNLCEVGVFETNMAMLNRLREATGIRESLITIDMLPPVLQDYYRERSSSEGANANVAA